VRSRAYVTGKIMLSAKSNHKGINIAGTSAFITLHDPEGKRTDREHFDMAMAFLRPVINEMSWASGVWFGERLVHVSDASPFLLFWAYQAMTIYRRLEGYYGEEVQQHKSLMQEKLIIMSKRWKAGGKNISCPPVRVTLILIRGIHKNLKRTRHYSDVMVTRNHT
jgi:hypothetical protein